MCENIKFSRDLAEPIPFIARWDNCENHENRMLLNIPSDSSLDSNTVIDGYEKGEVGDSSTHDKNYSNRNVSDENASAWIPPHLKVQYWTEPNFQGDSQTLQYPSNYTNRDNIRNSLSSYKVKKLKKWEEFKVDCCLMDEKDNITTPGACQFYWGDNPDNECSRNFMVEHCSKNLKQQKCVDWVRRMRENDKSSVADSAITKYCTEVNPRDPDCKCFHSSTDKEVQLIKQKGIRAPVECWYQPCTDIGNKDYMLTASQLDRLKSCTVVNCNIEDIDLDVGTLSGELQTSINNTCGIIEGTGETVKSSDTSQTENTTQESDITTTIEKIISGETDYSILIYGGVAIVVLILIILLL